MLHSDWKYTSEQFKKKNSSISGSEKSIIKFDHYTQEIG